MPLLRGLAGHRPGNFTSPPTGGGGYSPSAFDSRKHRSQPIDLDFTDIRDNDPKVEEQKRQEARQRCHDAQLILAAQAIKLGSSKEDLIAILETIGLPTRVPVEPQPKGDG